MLRKIKLYGQLAKFVGQRTLEAEVNNAAQAVRFLVVNFPGLEKHMAETYYKVSAGNWEISEEELHYPTGSNDIQIIPVVGGAGGNTGRFLLGVAMIGIAVALPGATFAASGGLGFGTTAGYWAGTAAIGNMGIYLALSGIAGMLTPVETLPENEQDPRRSFSFSGIQNTSRAGVAVPVVYGEIITGSVTISAGVDTEQVQV